MLLGMVEGKKKIVGRERGKGEMGEIGQSS